MKGTTLEYEGAVLIHIIGKWLYPLFGIVGYLKNCVQLERSKIILHDTIIGRAAAMLITNMGIVQVHANVTSRLASSLFEDHHVTVHTDTIVERIDCHTETMLQSITNIAQGMQMLESLAGSSSSQPHPQR